MCNQLLFQWMFLKLRRHIVDVLEIACGFLIELESILTELLLFKLKYFGSFLPSRVCILAAFCLLGYGVCVINSFYSFQWLFFKHCRHIVNILKMCMWVFDGARINFD